jgi:hypothetical protein
MRNIGPNPDMPADEILTTNSGEDFLLDNTLG